jgi:uncharacterized protein (TIGR00299 family) protein
MTAVLHVDASTGAAGDMLLAALLDAGADPTLVLDSIAEVLPGADVSVGQVTRAGLRAARVVVRPPSAVSPHRHWRDLRDSIAGANLPATIRQGTLAAFTLLAEAEATVHGIEPEQVHFHEVGAWDSVCDVVGTVAAVASLNPRLITCSTVATGSGTVSSDHGLLPVPAPAVAQLLATGGIPTHPGPASFEACTPTAAALLIHLVDRWQAGPAMRIERVGVGAGSKDPGPFANVTRVFVGQEASDSPNSGDTGLPPVTAVVLETNVDDIDSRLWPGIQQHLLLAGASDAWLTPIQMKKGRPATTLSVLCPVGSYRELARVIMETTPAIGMRVLPVGKIAAERSTHTVSVSGHPVRIKVATWQGETVNVQPEWVDVAAAAAALGEPEKVVLARSTAAAEAFWRPSRNS